MANELCHIYMHKCFTLSGFCRAQERDKERVVLFRSSNDLTVRLCFIPVLHLKVEFIQLFKGMSSEYRYRAVPARTYGTRYTVPVTLTLGKLSFA